MFSDENINDNNADVDEDNIDNVDEKVDENQAKDMYKCILKLGQYHYVQQDDTRFIFFKVPE